MTIQEIIHEIELFAPLVYQESYDNCGVQVGTIDQECVGALLTLDVTEAVIEEAIERNCNLIICHHPLIFGGIKQLSGKNYVQRSIIKAIKNDITIYAAHTNMDSVLLGVNHKIAEKIGLQDLSILQESKNNLFKLQTYIPAEHATALKTALFEAGAGSIGNYSECSYEVNGWGQFRGNDESNPTLGNKNETLRVAEQKLEFIVPLHLQSKIIQTLQMAHPYETVAYELIPLANKNQTIGAGMVGSLPSPMGAYEFLAKIKDTFKIPCIKHTAITKPQIQKVAFCGGSGYFLLNHAIQAKADIFITADYKYHQFFDAENKIVIADIGHFESEQYTNEIFHSILRKKFSNFAIYLSYTNTNPINYYS